MLFNDDIQGTAAVAADLLRWTNGRALVGTGSPFPPIDIDGKPIIVGNPYVFPGVGLGVLAVRAQGVSNDMFAAAAQALAAVSPAARDPDANRLPPVHDLRKGCGNRRRRPPGRTEGLCESFTDTVLDGLITQKMWEPVYRPYCRKGIDR